MFPVMGDAEYKEAIVDIHEHGPDVAVDLEWGIFAPSQVASDTWENLGGVEQDPRVL